MKEKTIRYNIDGRAYDIPESMSSEFEKLNPSSTIRMEANGRMYDIPLERKQEFLDAYSNARVGYDEKTNASNVGEEIPQKRSLFDSIASNPGLSAVAMNAPTTSSEPAEDRTGLGETIVKATGAAGTRLAKQALDLGRMAINNSSIGGIVNMISGKSYDERLQDEDALLTRWSIKLGDTADRLSREADPTGGEKGYVDLIREKRFGRLLQKAVGSGIESLPMMLAASNPYTAAAFGAAMMEDAYADETRENPDIPAWKRRVNAAGQAALELAVERIGGPLKGKKAGKEITEEVLQELMERAAREGSENIATRILKTLGKTLKEGAEEGGEELLTSFGNDALGTALDALDRDADYGIKAQWEQYKEQNPEASLSEFAWAKGEEYMDAFIGGAVSGMEISGTVSGINKGISLANGETRNAVQNARDAGASARHADMYDMDAFVSESADALSGAFSDSEGNPTISREFIDRLSAEDAYALAGREDLTREQRMALGNYAIAKAQVEGLNGRLDTELDERINAIRGRIEEATDPNSRQVITGVLNGRAVYVKEAQLYNDGKVAVGLSDKGLAHGPVVVIDTVTGEKTTVNSSEITNAHSEYGSTLFNYTANGLRELDAQQRNTARTTMSARAKTKVVSGFVGKKMKVDFGNGIIEVEVQHINPQTGEVMIKGKKGDLGGKSIDTIGAAAFYDSIYRDENGDPMFVENGEEGVAEVQETETPESPVEAEPQIVPESPDNDFRDFTGTIIVNGKPIVASVISQDGPTDIIVYEYEDENGNIKRASTTIGKFTDAAQQGASYTPETSSVETGPAVETLATEETPAAPEAPAAVVPLAPESIDWDALFEQDQEAYFAELQNQFGEEVADILNEEIEAARDELDSLDRKKGKTQNERLANRQKRIDLQGRIESLNGMVARLAPVAEAAAETPAESVSVPQAAQGIDISTTNDVPEPPVVTSVEKDPEPRNAVEFASRELAIRNGGIRLQWDSVKKHTGYTEGKRKKFIGLFASKDKGGMTMEEAGERLMELDRENNTGFFDQSDPNAGLNAILDALHENQTMGELRSYVSRQRMAEAQREADAAHSAIMAEYENMMLYEEVQQGELAENSYTEEEYNELMSILAEEINDYETEYIEGEPDTVYETEAIGDLPVAEGEAYGEIERSNQVLQETQPVQTAGERDSQRRGIDQEVFAENADSSVHNGEPSTYQRESSASEAASTVEDDLPLSNAELAALNTPAAPTTVANPVREAQKKEKSLATQLMRYDLSPEQKQDMAFNAGKKVADFFATREEYDAYAENATDLGSYNEDFERGVDESFANRGTSSDDGILYRSGDSTESDTTDDVEAEMEAIKEKAIKDGTFMKAPNGKPTNLTERQWLQVRTKNFIKWFGDFIKAANIKRGFDALQSLANGAESVPNAMRRDELAELGGTAEIEFAWGNEGKADSKGYIRKGSGFAKILQKHGVEDAIRVVGTIATGEIQEPYGPENGKRVDIVSGEYQTTISLFKDGTSGSWVLTGFKIDLNTDAKGRGSDLSNATQTFPIHTREDLGAALKSDANIQYFNDLTSDVSKVVDENGEPKVVYHGTGTEFYTFRNTSEDNELGSGFYFTDSYDTAERYSKDENLADNQSRIQSKTDDIFLGIMGHSESDLYSNDYTDDYNAAYDMAVNEVFRHSHVKAVFLNIRNPYIVGMEDPDSPPVSLYNTAAMAHNYNDGIIDNEFNERHETLSGIQYVAFKTNQIKSATDNVGLFDAENPDIRFRSSDSPVTPEMDAEYLAAVEAGDMETAQRMVLDAAKLAMPDTLVVDEAGNPRIVYHGSNAMFTVFDKSRIGSATGTADGRGFYFTTDRDYALGFKTPDGQLFDVFLNIDNPLSYDRKTITRAQLKKILKEADRVEFENEGEHYMLSNYANYNDVGIDGAINEGAKLEYDYADSDVELVGSLIGGSGSFDLIMDAVKKITGKSGMIAPKDNGTIHYVVTDPAAIKSAEAVTYDNDGNVIPLSERFNLKNADIRYRRGEVRFTSSEISEMETPILESRGTFKNLSEAENWAKDNLQDKSYVNRFTNDSISISGKSIKEMLNPNTTKKISEDVHMAAIMSVPEFIETGIPAEQHKDTHGRGFDVVRLYNAIEIDGKVYRVKSTVKKLKEGDRYYTYELQEMELIEDTQSTAVGSNGIPVLNSTNSMTGAKLLKGVKKTNSGDYILDEDNLIVNKTRRQNAAVNFLVGNARSFAIENAVNEEAAKLGVTVTYKTREEMPKGHKNDKGYYNTRTGEVVVCTENAVDINDAIQTILHEAVAHKGLRQLMGDRFNEFISRVYDSLDAETKAKVDALAEKSYKGDKAVAMEEYMATLAESTDFKSNSLWDRIKSIFEDIINAILGRNDIKIGDNELRYILRASYNNMVNPRGIDTIRGWAQNLIMRESYGIGNVEDEIAAIKANAIKDGTFMKAPNGQPTNLSEEQWLMVRTQGFIDWFGDWINDPVNASKIVDENGEPMVMVHGSPNEFSIFRRGKGPNGSSGRGIYFGRAPKDVESVTYGGKSGHKYLVFLNVRNLYDSYFENRQSRLNDAGKVIPDYVISEIIGTSSYEEFVESVTDINKARFASSESVIKDISEKTYRRIHDEYDGKGSFSKKKNVVRRIFRKNKTYLTLSHEYIGEIVVRDPNQIKSADPVTYDDNGNVIPLSQRFNLGNDDIRFRTGIDPDEASSEIAKEVYNRVVTENWQEFQRQLQDQYQPVRIAMDAILQETGNSTVEDYENFLLIMNQASSRSRVEIDKFQRKHFNPILKQCNEIIDRLLEARGSDVHDKAKRSEVYAEIRQYLIAKHGLERNLYYQTHKTKEVDGVEVPDVRDYSGLTALFGMDPKQFAEAEERARELVDSFEAELGDMTDALWNKINKATNKTLRHSYECGLISRQQYENIKSMFSFYIPLRGFDETTAEDVYEYSRFEGNSFNPPDKKTEGRTSLADDPIAMIMNMAENEISQGNKNRAKQALYYFVANRPNSLMEIRDVWYVKTKDAEGKVTYVEATPDDASGETYAEFEERMMKLAKDKKAKIRKGKVDVGMRFQKQSSRNEHYVYLKVNGVEKAIFINGNPKATQAINGTNRKEDGFVAKNVRTLSRCLSQTFTNYSLEFTARNYVRDITYATINLAVKEPDPAYRRKFRQNWRHNNLPTMLKMLNAYRAGEYDGGDLTEDEAAFLEFMENGGQTGYTLINSVERHKKDLEKALANMQNAIDKGGVKDSTVFKYTLGGIELLNEASELVTRFAAFKTSRDMGRSVVKSINDAKEITVNFNTKGAQDGTGWLGSIARILGLSKFFFNAAVQGVQNVKAMYNASIAKFGIAAAGILASGICIPMLNAALWSLLGDDDDDEAYWDIPEWERQNNICMIVGKGKYVKMPLPVGIGGLYAIGDMIAAAAWDKKFTRDYKQLGMDVASKIASMVLPINPFENIASGLDFGHTLLLMATPSPAQFVVQNVTNTDWKGAPLQKEYSYNKDDPQWTKAFSSNPDWLVAITRWANENLGTGDMKGVDWSPENWDNTLSNLGGGVYSLFKKMARTVSMIWNEDNRKLSNVPIGSVFAGAIDSEMALDSDYYEEKEYYDERLNWIETNAERFGYDLDEVFRKEVGKHQPEMLKQIYNKRDFDFMQEWYLGHKGNPEGKTEEERAGLDKLHREIKGLEKEINGMENPPQEKLNELSKKYAEFENFRREFVNDMMEL